MMEINNIEKIILFCLLEASHQDDPLDRELGPIHLVKYVYLADLAYSEYHNGEIYSGARWKFYHFGPWAVEVYNRIDSLVEEVGATKKIISSPKYEDDFIRYSYADDYKYNELSNALPLEIIGTLKKTIREFGKDTPELLHHVYRTRPMVCAAPDEYLDFTHQIKPTETLEREFSAEAEKLTVKRKNMKKRAIEELKEKVLNKRIMMKSKRKEWRDFTPPRYDDIYFEGVNWVESLAGEPIKTEEGILEIPNEFWKSSFRNDDEIC